jgi:hypothetical protein
MSISPKNPLPEGEGRVRVEPTANEHTDNQTLHEKPKAPQVR